MHLGFWKASQHLLGFRHKQEQWRVCLVLGAGKGEDLGEALTGTQSSLNLGETLGVGGKSLAVS